MSEIKIDKNVAIPDRAERGKWVALATAMEVGDSFEVVVDSPVKRRGKQAVIIVCLRRGGGGRLFMSRTTSPTSLRFWRVE